jgi:hypothetical protein
VTSSIGKRHTSPFCWAFDRPSTLRALPSAPPRPRSKRGSSRTPRLDTSAAGQQRPAPAPAPASTGACAAAARRRGGPRAAPRQAPRWGRSGSSAWASTWWAGRAWQRRRRRRRCACGRAAPPVAAGRTHAPSRPNRRRAPRPPNPQVGSILINAGTVRAWSVCVRPRAPAAAARSAAPFAARAAAGWTAAWCTRSVRCRGPSLPPPSARPCCRCAPAPDRT